MQLVISDLLATPNSFHSGYFSGESAGRFGLRGGGLNYRDELFSVGLAGGYGDVP